MYCVFTLTEWSVGNEMVIESLFSVVKISTLRCLKLWEVVKADLIGEVNVYFLNY